MKDPFDKVSPSEVPRDIDRRIAQWTTIVLWGCFVAFSVFVLADIITGNSPPYLYDIETATLPYPEWMQQQTALVWFWGGRPVWDTGVGFRVVWLLCVAALLLWKGPRLRLQARLMGCQLASPDREEDVGLPAGTATDEAARANYGRIPLFFVLILAAGVLWTFRSQDLRYGDSEFLTDLVPRETAAMGANIAYEEILDCTLHCRLYDHLNRWFDMDIVTVFNGIGIAMTLIGIGIVWPFWHRRGGLPAAMVLTLWFATGWSHLFFGHVEYYSSVAVVLLVYATLAVAHLERGHIPFWVCCGVAGLSVGFHMLAAWIWPTLAILFWEDWRRRGRSPVFLLATGIPAFLLPIAASVGVATLYGFPPTRFGDTHLAHMKFIFLLTEENALDGHRAIYQYPFLSIRHIWNNVNEWVRVAWPGIVLVATLLVPAVILRLWRRPTVRFWIVAAVGFQTFALVWNPDLGYHRDWDLFAVVALGWTGLGIEWLRQLNREGWSELAARVLLFVLSTAVPMRILQLLHHSWWVGPLNHSGMF